MNQSLFKMAAAVEPPLNLGIHEGTMVKRIIDMTPQEREVYYKAVALKAKERLFAIGQPWVYEKNGQVLAEYADGRIEIID